MEPEIADEDLPLAEIDGRVELGDVGPIDLEIVELVAADTHREALERRLELLVGLGVEHPDHERHRHAAEPTRPRSHSGSPLAREGDHRRDSPKRDHRPPTDDAALLYAGRTW
ncbi:MAG: hypothetical protein QM820_62825 [Minicystis sp.]